MAMLAKKLKLEKEYTARHVQNVLGASLRDKGFDRINQEMALCGQLSSYSTSVHRGQILSSSPTKRRQNTLPKTKEYQSSRLGGQLPKTASCIAHTS